MSTETKAIVYETDGWFMALCNDYPGITGEGTSRDECIADLTTKIEQHLAQNTASSIPVAEIVHG